MGAGRKACCGDRWVWLGERAVIKMVEGDRNGPGLPAGVGVIGSAGLRARTEAALRLVWEGYQKSLPDGHEAWARGAAYIRESDSTSLTGDSPEGHLKWILGQFIERRIWADWDDVYFDNVSATSVEDRPAFRRLYEAAMRKVYAIVMAHRSDRLFRNAAEAREYRADLRRVGVEVEWYGQLKGDRRSPGFWQAESMQDLLDEYWARMTSQNVGLTFQRLTREGRPIGPLPEGYRVGLRADSHQGMQGRPLTWIRNEPLASIIVEAKDLYLSGMTYAQITAWAAAGPLKGLRPCGRPMTEDWWKSTLQNPKYAGFQMPSEYMGFRPGKEDTPKAPRRQNLVTRLVPSLLPPLYPLEDWKLIVETGEARLKAPKARKRYRVSLLSTVAIDRRCGHGMQILKRRGEKVFMVCGRPGLSGAHSGPIRVDLAEAELDEIFSDLQFDDPVLVDMVGQELERLERRYAQAPAFRANPEIARLNAALAALGSDVPDSVSAGIRQRLNELVERDEAIRAKRSETGPKLRACVQDLSRWRDVWANGSVEAKNQLLRGAKVRVILGRMPWAKRGPAVVRSIEVGDPILGVALRIATSKVALERSRPLQRANPTIVTLDPVLEELVSGVLEGMREAA